MDITKQQINASISNLLDFDGNRLSFDTQTLSESNDNIVGDVSTASFWPIVPKSMHKQAFKFSFYFMIND